MQVKAVLTFKISMQSLRATDVILVIHLAYFFIFLTSYLDLCFVTSSGKPCSNMHSAFEIQSPTDVICHLKE